MEQQVDRQSVVKAHELLWHHFIEQHEIPSKEIALDFDGTDIPVYGDQPGSSFTPITTTTVISHCTYSVAVTYR